MPSIRMSHLFAHQNLYAFIRFRDTVQPVLLWSISVQFSDHSSLSLDFRLPVCTIGRQRGVFPHQEIHPAEEADERLLRPSVR
jgi:hypothetical protein